MLRCAQMHREHFPVASSSSTRTYTVTMFRPDELPECTCIAFRTKRNKAANEAGGGFPGAGAGLARKTPASCKHLDEVRRLTCDWEQGDEAAPDVCPRCGGPVVDAAAPLLPAGLGPVSIDPKPGEAAGPPPAAAHPAPPPRPADDAAPLDAAAAATKLTELLGDA